MPLKDRTIGGHGETSPDLGNDYSRDITREQTSDDTLKNVIPDKDKNKKDKEQPEPDTTETDNVSE